MAAAVSVATAERVAAVGGEGMSEGAGSAGEAVVFESAFLAECLPSWNGVVLVAVEIEGWEEVEDVSVVAVTVTVAAVQRCYSWTALMG